MKSCPKCASKEYVKNGMIDKFIMSKNGKKEKKIQCFKCSNGHFFKADNTNSWDDSFIEFVVFIYLRCLSLNTTVEIIRATYEEDILTKGLILDFIENVADALPTIEDIDRIFKPRRSGFLAFDGVWFKYDGKEIVLLVCFDPKTFDVINAVWGTNEDFETYSTLVLRVLEDYPRDQILGIYGDGDRGLLQSLKTHLAGIPFQVCIVHKEMLMGKKVPIKSVNISKKWPRNEKRRLRNFNGFLGVLFMPKQKRNHERP